MGYVLTIAHVYIITDLQTILPGPLKNINGNEFTFSSRYIRTRLKIVPILNFLSGSSRTIALHLLVKNCVTFYTTDTKNYQNSHMDQLLINDL